MKIAALCLVNVLFLLAVPAIGQQRTGPPVRRGVQPPPETVEVVSVPDPLDDYPEKGLPDSIGFGGVPSAELAERAAATILSGNEDALPALVGALQKGGFHIIDRSGKILFKPTAEPNGTAFYDFEVAGMLRATQLGLAITLQALGDTLAAESPDLRAMNVPAGLLEDLRSARNSNDRMAKYLATLVFALGRGTSDLSSVRSPINLMQASIIERRYLAEMILTYEDSETSSLKLFPGGRRSSDSLQFINASIQPTSADLCSSVEMVDKLQGFESKLRKAGQTYFEGRIFGRSIPSIFTWPKQQFKTNFERLAKGFEYANVVLAYVKLIAANLLIETKLEVEKPHPLVRTKYDLLRGVGEGLWTHYEPGHEPRILTAEFEIKFKGSDEINCTAKAAKAIAGLDLSVPKGGPMKSIPLNWIPKEEGTGSSRFTQYPVQLYSTDSTRPDVSKQKTDNNGANRIRVRGKPQQRSLENDPVVPYSRRARIQVTIATEDMDAKKDIGKLLGLGASGPDYKIPELGSGVRPGAGLLAAIEIVPSIMAKMSLKTTMIYVPVRDWQPCTSDWGGVITYSQKLKRTTVVKGSRTSNGNSTGDGIRRVERDVNIDVTLNPRTEKEILANEPPKPADYVVNGRYLDTFEGTREGDPCCGPTEGTYYTRFKSGRTERFSDRFSAPFETMFTGHERDFSAGFMFHTPQLQTDISSYNDVTDTNCPLEEDEARNSDSNGNVALMGELPLGRYGERFLNPSSDVLTGTRSYQLPDGTEVKWTWRLERCKG